jgi:hypothetical protein
MPFCGLPAVSCAILMDSFTAMAKRITKTRRLSLMVGLPHKTAGHGLTKSHLRDPIFQTPILYFWTSELLPLCLVVMRAPLCEQLHRHNGDGVVSTKLIKQMIGKGRIIITLMHRKTP